MIFLSQCTGTQANNKVDSMNPISRIMGLYLKGDKVAESTFTYCNKAGRKDPGLKLVANLRRRLRPVHQWALCKHLNSISVWSIWIHIAHKAEFYLLEISHDVVRNETIIIQIQWQRAMRICLGNLWVKKKKINMPCYKNDIDSIPYH